MARLYEVSQFPPLKVIQFDARVAVHVAAHGGPPVRGVGVEVDFALAVLVVLVDAHGVVGNEGLGELGVVIEGENGTGLVGLSTVCCPMPNRNKRDTQCGRDLCQGCQCEIVSASHPVRYGRLGCAYHFCELLL